MAFAHKTDKELKEAYRLFSLIRYAGLVRLGTRVLPWAIRAGLPVKGLLRHTIFRQFVGGETLEQTIPVVQKLAAAGVQVILDYGVEAKEGEESFDAACAHFLQVIHFAAAQSVIPFISLKMTGLARFSLLEKLATGAGRSGKEYPAAVQGLTPAEAGEWQRATERMAAICQAASRQGTSVLVDAEESWIQGGIDGLVLQLMETWNTGRPVVYNTVQLYLRGRLPFLEEMYRRAEDRKFIAGVKLVRGAYMEKENERARALDYPSPVQPGKAATDREFNEAVTFGMNHLDRLSLMVASHNEESNLLAWQRLQEHALPPNHAHVHFSQLYGMSDHITFNLAKKGCNVSKYLPFGPIADVIPYLMRRARENSSVQGQTGRELGLLKKEMKRRGL